MQSEPRGGAPAAAPRVPPPATSPAPRTPVAPAPPSERPAYAPGRRRALVGAVAVLTALALAVTARTVVPRLSGSGHGAPAPAERAALALASGAPAAPADLAALVTEREAAVRAEPGDARSWALLGAGYVAQGERSARPEHFPRAERALRASLRARPRGNADAHDGRARLAWARGDARGAERAARQALAADPKRWAVYPVLVEAYEALGEPGAADRALDRLTGLRTGAQVLAAQAEHYRARGRREDAAAALQDAAALAGSPAEEAGRWAASGAAAAERGEPAEALRYYEAALRRDPGLPAAAAGRARALAALGRTRAAVSAWRAVLGRAPDPRWSLELGELYEALGRAAEARARYAAVREGVRRAEAAGADGTLLRARLEADHGDPAAAVRQARALWRRAPGTAAADALGWALHRAGRDREARRYALRALELGRRSALYVYHRARIEQSLGDGASARRRLREALQLDPAFSPLLAPRARAALRDLGEPPETDPGT